MVFKTPGATGAGRFIRATPELCGIALDFYIVNRIKFFDYFIGGFL